MQIQKTIIGTVMKGAMLGRKMGFPTINVVYDVLELPYGVYVSRVWTDNGAYKGALHFGPRRILNVEEPALEVHLLDFSGDLYGQKVKIDVLEKIRDTQDFENMESLKKQIRLDVDAVRATEMPLK